MILSGAGDPGRGGLRLPGAEPAAARHPGDRRHDQPADVTTYAFFDAAPRPKYLLTLLGAPHLRPYTDEQPQLGIVERVTIAFLDAYLKRSPRGAHADGSRGTRAREGGDPGRPAGRRVSGPRRRFLVTRIWAGGGLDRPRPTIASPRRMKRVPDNAPRFPLEVRCLVPGIRASDHNPSGRPGVRCLVPAIRASDHNPFRAARGPLSWAHARAVEAPSVMARPQAATDLTGKRRAEGVLRNGDRDRRRGAGGVEGVRGAAGDEHVIARPRGAQRRGEAPERDGQRAGWRSACRSSGPDGTGRASPGAWPGRWCRSPAGRRSSRSSSVIAGATATADPVGSRPPDADRCSARSMAPAESARAALHEPSAAVVAVETVIALAARPLNRSRWSSTGAPASGAPAERAASAPTRSTSVPAVATAGGADQGHRAGVPASEPTRGRIEGSRP